MAATTGGTPTKGILGDILRPNKINSAITNYRFGIGVSTWNDAHTIEVVGEVDGNAAGLFTRFGWSD